MPHQALLEISHLSFRYPRGDFILNCSHFRLKKGEHVFIKGPSGQGKSTFLSLLTGLLLPQKGEIMLYHHHLNKLSCNKRDQLRARHFGIIFQLFNLIDYLSVLENVMLPCFFSKTRAQRMNLAQPELEARRLCLAMGLEEKQLLLPIKSLSIGQQQRVALCRALIGRPDIIIADEATSALDSQNKARVLDLLFQEAQESAILFVSHDEQLKSYFNRFCLGQDLFYSS